MDGQRSLLVSGVEGTGGPYQYAVNNSNFQTSQVFNGPYDKNKDQYVFVKNSEGCVAASVFNFGKPPASKWSPVSSYQTFTPPLPGGSRDVVFGTGQWGTYNDHFGFNVLGMDKDNIVAAHLASGGAAVIEFQDSQLGPVTSVDPPSLGDIGVFVGNKLSSFGWTSYIFDTEKRVFSYIRRSDDHSVEWEILEYNGRDLKLQRIASEGNYTLQLRRSE